jgi:hypothetical protein
MSIPTDPFDCLGMYPAFRRGRRAIAAPVEMPSVPQIRQVLKRVLCEEEAAKQAF